jgi:hypothetical protein
VACRRLAEEIYGGLGPVELTILEYVGEMSVRDFNYDAPESPWRIVRRLVTDADHDGSLGDLEWFETYFSPRLHAPHPEARPRQAWQLREDADRRKILAGIAAKARRRVAKWHANAGIVRPSRQIADKAAARRFMRAIKAKAEAAGIRVTPTVIKDCCAHLNHRRGVRRAAAECYRKFPTAIKPLLGRPVNDKYP